MTQYGVRVRDTSGNILLITPDIHSIVSSGRVSMPAALNDDDTYGLTIDLPGTATYADTGLGVLATPFELAINAFLFSLDAGGFYGMSWFVNDTYTYYTRNESTGVMTEWTPATASVEVRDGLLAVYPVAFWDKMGETTFTSIRIFAAMCHEVYDQSATSFIKVYAIYTQGVETVDYAIYARHYSED